MSKKKLEVVELNKKEEKIVLEEKQKPIVSFWRLHRFNIIVAMLLIGLIVFITGSFIFISNIYKNNKNGVIYDHPILFFKQRALFSIETQTY